MPKPPQKYTSKNMMVQEVQKHITKFTPEYLQNAHDFIDMYFFDDRTELRRDAHNLLKMILKEGVFKYAAPKENESHSIDPELADTLTKLLKSKKIDVETVEDDEEE